MKKRAGRLVDKAKAAQDELAVDADARVKLLRRENAELRKKLAERETGRDILLGVLLEVFGDMEPLRIPQPPKPRKGLTNVEQAVLHLSDVHFGKRTQTYNMAVAEERIILAGEKTRQITNLRRSEAKIDTLHLLLGGDMGEGEGEIFPGQAHEIDADVIAQSCREGPRVIAELIVGMLAEFQRISVKGVPGNHGKSSRQAAKRNNFDNWFYDITRHMVEKQLTPKDAARIEWDLPFDRPPGREWWAHSVICDRWGALVVHGDQIKGQLGMPWYGFGKKTYGWIDAIPLAWDYLFSGHFHTAARIELNSRTVLANGTTESENAYAQETMAAGGRPQQRLCFFDASHGMIADKPLYLGDREPNR